LHWRGNNEAVATNLFDDNSSGIFRNRLFLFLVNRIIWSLNLGIVRAKRKNKLLFFHNEEIIFIFTGFRVMALHYHRF
jgi:hypothetical protein